MLLHLKLTPKVRGSKQHVFILTFSVGKESRQGFTGSSAWALSQAAVKVSAWAAVLFEGSPGEGTTWCSLLWCWQHSVPWELSSHRR